MLKKIIQWVATVWIILMTIIIGGVSYYKNILNHPIKNIKSFETITIKSGDTVNSVINNLKKENKLRNSIILRLYIKQLPETPKLSPGTFEIKNSMNIDDILYSMKNSKAGDANLVKVTIPEGYTIDQIAEALEKSGVLKKDDFINSCNKYPLPPYIKKDSKRKYPLEGYLFPATYEFKKGSDSKDIIDYMINTFNNRVDKVQQDVGISVKPEDIDKIITLASIIEGEIQSDDERRLASSVLYNRLKINMRLEMDSTIQYALEKRKPVLSNDDYKLDSPYNTYVVFGLPVGPIGNPGEASIAAAIEPDETKYLYFVSRNDGTHEFNENYNEHLKAVRKYQNK